MQIIILFAVTYYLSKYLYIYIHIRSILDFFPYGENCKSCEINFVYSYK